MITREALVAQLNTLSDYPDQTVAALAVAAAKMLQQDGAVVERERARDIRYGADPSEVS